MSLIYQKNKKISKKQKKNTKNQFQEEKFVDEKYLVYSRQLISVE